MKYAQFNIGSLIAGDGVLVLFQKFWIGLWNGFKTCFRVGVFVLLLITTGVASGQTCCTGGVPVTGSLGLGAADVRSLQLQFSLDHNFMNDLLSVNQPLGENNRQRQTHSGLLELNYGLSRQFSLAALFSYVRQDRIVITQSGQREHEHTRGLGDMVLLMKYRLIDKRQSADWELLLGAGPKIPLAQTNLVNAAGLLLPADMQPGTGSWDGIFWSSFMKNHLLWNNVSLTALSTFRWSGENNNYLGNNSYRFGNEFQVISGIGYQFFAGTLLDVFQNLRYRYQGPDQFNGTNLPGTGGHWVYLIPGVQVNPRPDLSLRLSAEIPVYRHLKGIQLTTSYRLSFSILARLWQAEEAIIENIKTF